METLKTHRVCEGELRYCAATWILGAGESAEDQAVTVTMTWPFDLDDNPVPKFKGHRQDLIRGIAVAMAEVERIIADPTSLKLSGERRVVRGESDR